MTIQEFKFLKLLNSVTSYSEAPFFYDSNDASIHLVDNTERLIPCHKLSSEINGLISSLEDKKYIEHIPTYGLDEENYRLTQKGLHRFQFSIETILKFLITSVFIPIVVAFVTTLITVMLQR